MFLDILFPRSCLSCSRFGSYICQQCRQKIEVVEKDSCLFCNKISKSGGTHSRCLRPDGLDGVISFFYFTPVLQRILSGIKYNLVSAAWNDLFTLVDPLVLSKTMVLTKKHPDISLCPIPLHNRRLNRRGFNQAEIISNHVSSLTGLPLIHPLVRVQFKKAQAKVEHRVERYYNIYNSFKVKKEANVAGKTILLVDDVITSGNTMGEVCRVLKICGAQKVFGLALCKR